LSAVSDNNKVNEEILNQLSVLSRAINRNAAAATNSEEQKQTEFTVNILQKAIQTSENDIKKQEYISCVEKIADELLHKYQNKKDTTIRAEDSYYHHTQQKYKKW
jgi:uncharacterized membrane protein